MSMKWKKVAAASLALMISLSGTASFADGLDTAYVDLMLTALKAQPAEERESFGDLLKITLYDADAIEVTKSNYQTQLTDTQKDFIETNGITPAIVIRNLEALKTWSFEDRMALIDAATTLNRNGMISLNNKYETKTSTGGSVFTPPEEVKQTLTDRGIALEKPVLGIKTEFKDMTKHWSTSYVTLLTRAGVIAGFPDQTYRPEQPLTRAEVITMLVKALSKDYKTLKPAALPLDVRAADWHYDFMAYASYLGLYEVLDGRALPDEPLTREKTANLLSNMAMVLKLNPEGGTSLNFTDISTLSATSQEDLLWLTKMGIFSGYPDGTFRPQDIVTRAEASVLMIKMMQLFYGTLE
ncbi:MAG: hypothetical protein GT601_14310 [Acidaminobacter sp.]|uniref:S-layer homology domain-containing protein n=1 Tax=Acidaminobacter sp. TaxID=1872102 RepID=UPI001381BFC8|nr:S-layer homology domain-containing protein [Acidaminobacter sp.]MZQ98838.1 hypothetical protein [Acidaminobacter sp.]